MFVIPWEMIENQRGELIRLVSITESLIQVINSLFLGQILIHHESEYPAIRNENMD